ncbi:MAG: serine/threonine protein kinase [Frankiales bacterium]|nr:serine/threonine protein kinase [Frankiales bacterium]
MTSPEDPTEAVPTAAFIGGRYRLDELIGRGGTAEVWRATDTSLDRTVALKLVTVPADESSARAADEARTLARLSHPSLVQVFDAGTDTSGRPWVVMELVQGETLADAIRRGPLAVRTINEIGLAVAEALDHVHSQGLVHRDVKPANVLMGRGGKTKLTDFGISKLVDAAKVTSTGFMVGTASYLAPEQVTGEPVGPPADIYALGLVLLEALTGQREYEGPAVEAAMARLHRPPTMPQAVPPSWVPLLTQMLAREPAARPTAAATARGLRALLSGQAVATTVLEAPTRAIPQATQAIPVTRAVPVVAASSNRNTWIAVAVAVALVAVLAGVLASRRAASPREIPAVSTEIQQPLQSDLNKLKTQVEQ